LSLPRHRTLYRSISALFSHLLSILIFNRVIVCTQLSCTLSRYTRVPRLISIVTSQYMPFDLLFHVLSFFLHNKLYSELYRSEVLNFNSRRPKQDVCQILFRRENFSSIHRLIFYLILSRNVFSLSGRSKKSLPLKYKGDNWTFRRIQSRWEQFFQLRQ